MSTDPVRWCWAALVVVLWIALTAVIALRKRRRASAVAISGQTLVAVASQTGFGDELAEMTRDAIIAAGGSARIVSFADLTSEDLLTIDRVLFVASTTGEGDAPDSAARFVRKVMGEAADLAGLRYGLLALGDRTYRDYCGFGRALDDWLKGAGARRLFDTIEVDDGDAEAIARWRDEIARLTGSAEPTQWDAPRHKPWRLVERRLLNAGSPGEEAWFVAFTPEDGGLDWVAGDIAEFQLSTPEGEPAHREYSVASLPSDGRAEFVVRLMRRPDGTPGLGSGRLTTMKLGDALPMRVRTNRAFHGPEATTPIILIGNGTGIAGLRAHLKQRAASGPAGSTWLMFGERTAAHDSLFDDELTGWMTRRALTRLDRVFSRDPGDGRYVQAIVAAAADEVRAWVADGAAIYVCGSLEGMAGGVREAMEDALGRDLCRELIETGRYRQDVY
ncbi:MAG: sulfite reductase subunit alpha [Pseudomonadota bacterium]